MEANMTAQAVMRRACRAFCTGDLTDRAQLKDALTWVNFRNSRPRHSHVAECVHRLPAGDLLKLPNATVRPLDDAEYCQGYCSDEVKRVFWVDVSKGGSNTLPLHMPLTDWEDSPLRTQLLNQARDRLDLMQRKVLWVTDFENEAISGLDAAQLLSDLGRYGQQLTHADRVVVYEIEAQVLYKPTMVDAGFAFYWLAWQRDDAFGMTRELKNALPKYREWIVPKTHVRFVNAWPLNVCATSLSEKDIPTTYWDECISSVTSLRSNH